MARSRKPAGRAAVEAAKAGNLGQLLLKAARLYDTEGRRRVDFRGLGPFKPAHARLFPHIDWEGTRITDLAARVGTTKQAVGQTVSELEDAGLLERRADADDGRVRRVHFTAAGERAMVSGLGVLREIEHEVTSELGERRIKALERTLEALIEALEGTA